MWYAHQGQGWVHKEIALELYPFAPFLGGGGGEITP